MSREIGIRRAIGATATDIAALVSARVAYVVGLGWLIGIVLSVSLLRIAGTLTIWNLDGRSGCRAGHDVPSRSVGSRRLRDAGGSRDSSGSGDRPAVRIGRLNCDRIVAAIVNTSNAHDTAYWIPTPQDRFLEMLGDFSLPRTSCESLQPSTPRNWSRTRRYARPAEPSEVNSGFAPSAAGHKNRGCCQQIASMITCRTASTATSIAMRRERRLAAMGIRHSGNIGTRYRPAGAKPPHHSTNDAIGT